MSAAASVPTWPAIPEDHPLHVLHAELSPLLSEQPPHKMWGITLSPSQDHFLTKIVLQKFLRSTKGNKELAKKYLEDTLQWRRGYFDADGKVIGSWDESKFQNLGYITTEIVKNGEGEKKVVVTWNIYGNVKDFAKTFGDVEEFLRWRVSLMEKSIALLDLPSAKQAIPDYNAAEPTVDPYQAIQVHDYLQVSFFRTPTEVRVASKKTIELFQNYYPELLDKKFFVNVPLIMGWVYTAMKALIAKETFKKLSMLSYGGELAKNMGSTTIPAIYGGSGEPLQKVDNKEDAIKGDPTPTAPPAVVGAALQEPSTNIAPAITAETKATGDADPTPAPVTTTSDPVVPIDTVPAPTNEPEKK